MTTELVKTETSVAKNQPQFVNPLMIDVTGDRIDAVINDLIETALGTVESEMHRIARRRQVAAAIRGIRAAKEQLDGLTEADAALGIVGPFIEGLRSDLDTMFRTLNPDAELETIQQAIESLVGPYATKMDSKRTPRKPK